MDVIRQVLMVAAVLGLLAATLWWLRRGGFARFNVGTRRSAKRRLETLERLALSPQHYLHLVRVADRMMLISSSPGSCNLIDSWPTAADAAGNGGQEVGR